MSGRTADQVADLLTLGLARWLVDGVQAGVRTLAVTSPMALVAGLVARRTGAPDLAIAAGFGILDAIDPVVSLTGGEAAFGVDRAARGPASDTFVALARGRVAVAVTPAQLDVRGAVNLSGIGGEPGRPAVALPGHRGLPENNDSPSRVAYLLLDHSPRALVGRVDVESGPPPSPGRHRRLLTPLGEFALEPGVGWRAVTLSPGVTAEAVAERTGFAVTVGEEVGVTPEPTDEERAALAAADPHGIRALPLLDRDAAAERTAAIAKAEQGG